MEGREHILHEALLKNEDESQRWLKYKNDHEDAVKNLQSFRKKLNVDVMVPIGNKALMPGHLIHTNEVLISHFGKMFSKCTSFQAQDICNNRIKIANDFLSKLDTEKDFFTNKLEMPYAYGAIPEAVQQEILEEYDEEAEEKWRKEHKIRVREEKLKENNESAERTNKPYEDIMSRLEELEMMDELETELEQYGIDDDVTLKKLMSGEIPLKEKQRVSHYNNVAEENISQVDTHLDQTEKKSKLEKLYTKYKVNKVPESQIDAYNTNNNTIPNIDFDNSVQTVDSDELFSSDEDYAPEEFYQIKKEADKIETFKKKVNFVRKKIKAIEKEVDTMKVSNPNDLDVKLNKIEVRDCLIDFVLTLDDENNADNCDLDSNMLAQKEIEFLEQTEAKPKKTKRISFALKDDITYIDKKQKVEDMLNGKREQLDKDKIVIDPWMQNSNVENTDELSNKISELSIMEKVERSVENMKEKQSHEDFDLVSKIINSGSNENKTLQIRFKHSPSVFVKDKKNYENNDIGSPADLYEIFGDMYPQNLSFTSQHEQLILEDIKTNGSIEDKPVTNLFEEKLQKVGSVKQTPLHTILKNKDAVKQETHFKEEHPIDSKIPKQSSKNKQNKKRKTENIQKMTLGDVIENPAPEKPDELPEGDFIDAHAPKKRISKFKQSRSVVL